MKHNARLAIIISLFLVMSILQIGNVLACGFGWWACDEVGEDCCARDSSCLTGCNEGLVCDSNNRCQRSAPPANCPVQAAGCYTTTNNNAPAGTIKPNQFGYYLPQNKCFKSGSPPNPVNLCGNGNSDPGEQCGEPSLSQCSNGQICSGCTCTTPNPCGNGNCDSGEDNSNCPSDCPALPLGMVITDITGMQTNTCGDGMNSCDPGEDCSSCPNDCGPCQSPTCGNSACDPSDCSTCPGECAGTSQCNAPPPSNPPSSQGCQCPSGSAENNQQTDADASSGACGCVQGASYGGTGGCCGDDASDCGRTNGEDICSMPMNLGTSNAAAAWIDASSKTADTITLQCNGAMYLSNGSDWIKCLGTFDGGARTIKVNNHEYLCQGFGRESIVECCGAGNCQSSNTETRTLTTGQIVRPTLHSPDPTFPFDLDTYSTGTSGYPAQQPQSSPPTYPSGIGCTEPIGSCSVPAGPINYKDNVLLAIRDFISSSSAIANSPNSNPTFVNSYLLGVASLLRSRGFEATRSLTCGDMESPDGIIVRRPGDQYGEFYEIIINVGSGRLLSDTANIQFIERANWARSISTDTGYGNDIVYYCRTDGSFSLNLDTPGTNSQGNSKPIDASKDACISAGYKWTGSKCCGEPGLCNFHEDLAGNGDACWNSTINPSVSLVGSNKSVILYGGMFHGCTLGKSDYNSINDAYIELIDKGTNNQLIEDHPSCFNDPTKFYFCSFTEQWLPTQGKQKTNLSFYPMPQPPPANPPQLAECCGATECWNGTICIADQSNIPTALPLNGKRCISGQWQSAFLKYTPDESDSGYCSIDSQCLVDPRAAQNQCTDSGNYINDYYCESGIWTTRTKNLALKLLDMKSGSFTLFCDTRANALNNIQYMSSSNEIIDVILTNLGTNNFCVLRNNNLTIGAVSLNRDVENIAGGINIFNVANCNVGLSNDGQYHPCDSSNKVWYNKKYKSLIYSQNPISVPSSNPNNQSQNLIQTYIQTIVSVIRNIITPPTLDTYYVNKLKKFDRLYISDQNGKIIRGVVEGPTTRNIVIGYTGFSTDICGVINQYNAANKDLSSGIACQKQGNTNYVLAQGNTLTNVNPDKIWTDLTSKMRVK